MRDFIKRARDQARGGDVNVAQVGEGAQVDQLAVGRNIFQAKLTIGTFVLPVRFVLALVVVGLVVAIAAWFYFVPAQMPGDTMNIAVATFGELGANGSVTSSERGAELSAWLAAKLEDEQENLPEGVRLTIWHDGMTFLQKRAAVGAISSEGEAQARAKQLNADLVIYGNLEANQDPATFVPMFHVNQQRHNEIGEADELTGAQQLGKALLLPNPLNNAYLDLNLRPRARALVWFARGISFDQFGEYDDAFQIFCQAEAELKDWKRDQGKEVLYYFIGREALFLGRNDEAARKSLDLPPDEWGPCEPFERAADATDAAEKWFALARDTNPEYARAYFGLGQAHTQRANAIVRSGASDLASLTTARAEAQRAVVEYETALQLLPASGGAPSMVDLKTRGALGSTFVLLATTFLQTMDWDKAQAELDKAKRVLELLVKEIPADAPRLLTQSHLVQATAYRLQGHAHLSQNDANGARSSFEAALASFDECVRLAQANKLDDFLQSDVLPNCERQREEVQQALR